jgi:hypothetical protein
VHESCGWVRAYTAVWGTHTHRPTTPACDTRTHTRAHRRTLSCCASAARSAGITSSYRNA